MASRIRVRNLKQVLRRSKRSQKNINTASRLGIQAAAIVLQQTAQAQAPVDSGALEDAIKVEKANTTHNHGARIYVDEEMTNEDGRLLAKYAVEQHEKLAPAGHWKLGKKSVEKQQHSAPGITVGGKYMDRALKVQERQIMKAFDNTIRSVVRKDRAPKLGRLAEFTRLTRKFLHDSR